MASMFGNIGANNNIAVHESNNTNINVNDKNNSSV